MITQSNHHFSLLVGVTTFLVLNGCVSDKTGAPPPPSTNLATAQPDELGTARLSGFKSECEEWAKQIKTDFAGKPERVKAEALYISARAGIESWVTQVKLDIANGHRDGLSPAAQKLLTEASAGAQKFIDYVNQLYARGSISAANISLIGDAYKLLSTAINDFFIKPREDQDKARIALLETMKWRAFADL